MVTLHRDYETRSALDLRKHGSQVYAEHHTTDVIVACFAFGDEEPWPWYPGEPPPPAVVKHIEEGGIVAGHNSLFEYAIDMHIMGPRYGFPVPKLEQCDCTLARSAIQALPLDLDRLAIALGLREKKDADGHRLMLRMCKPRKIHPDGHIDWWDDADRVQRLTEYCKQDVRAERGADKILLPMTETERPVWLLDQKINLRGVRIDQGFVDEATVLAANAAQALDEEIEEVTGGAVTKASQVERIKDFAKSHGVVFKIVDKVRRNGEEYEAEAADKEALEDHLVGDDLPDVVRRVFEIRLDAGKSSTKKLTSFKKQTCVDGRARMTLQYGGAVRTLRWAGRGIQLQNLPRAGVDGKHGGWDEARRDMAELGIDMMELVWGPPLDLLSRMLRGALIADPGMELIGADYAQIEARASVWAARQLDAVQLFANDGLIYEEMGSFIFSVDVQEVIDGHKKKTDIIKRFVGKEAILGCGFGIGPSAFQRNCKKKGKILLPIETAEKAVYGWREKNPRVVALWYSMEDAARGAIEHPGSVNRAGPYAYRVVGNWLQCKLPSGRVLWYRRPALERDELRSKDAITYWELNGYTRQWAKERSWGGKLFENAIQATARDLLAASMLKLEAAGYPLVLTCHDENISEIPKGFGSEEEYVQIMINKPDWAKGLPVKAEGWRGPRYAK